MKNLKLNAIMIALTSAIGLAGCAGDATQDASAPKSTTGVITGFGSVFVNGVEYETTGAAVVKDGVGGLDESVLKVGMVVSLEGDINADGLTGSASSIRFADEVEGLVLNNTVAVDNTIDVMGQLVYVDAETVFESFDPAYVSPADVPQNARVEVSGYSNGSGTIYATRIEVKQHNAAEEMEIKGVVSGLNTGAMTFSIGGLSVNYGGATFPASLADGLYVQVKSTTVPAANVLSATKVEIEDDGVKGEHGTAGEDMELEGVVTAVVSNTEIGVNGQQVLISTDTQFDNITYANLLVGTKIKLEGSYNADGVLVADEIKAKMMGDIEIQAYVDAADATNGTVLVLGQTIHVTNNTTLMDGRDQNGAIPERFFNVVNLAANDWVELKAYKDQTTGAMIATVLERNDDEMKPIMLQGTIDSAPAAGQAVVAGFNVSMSDALLAGLGAPLTAGAAVEITGTYTGNVFAATQITVK